MKQRSRHYKHPRRNMIQNCGTPHWILLMPLLLVLVSCTQFLPPIEDEGQGIKLRGSKTTGKRVALDIFARGSAYQMRGHFAEAILEFQKALKYDESAAIHLAVAQCFMELDDLEQAAVHINRGLELNPDFLPLHEARGQYHVFSGRIDDAILNFRYLDSLQPNTLSAKVTLARLYELRNLDSAISVYEVVLAEREADQQDENFPILAKLADLYEATGDSLRYIAMLEKMNASTTALSYLPFQLMQAYVQQNDLAKAYELMHTAAYTVPADDVDFYFASYATVLLERIADSGAMPEAVDEYTNFLDEVDPPGWLGPYYAALLRYEIGDSSKAEEWFDRTLEYAETVEDVPIRVSLHYLRSDQAMRAVDLLNIHEEQYPQNPEYPFYQGMAWQQLGDLERAIEDLDRTTELAPDFVDAWIQLGNIFSLTGDHDKSDGAYEQALDLAPESALINNNYAYALSERGIQLERAKRMAEMALAVEPGNASYLDTMGWIYFQLEQYDKALTYIRRSVAVDDSSATVYEHLGDCYAKLGQTDNAREAWLRALELEPDRDSTLERLGRRGG